MGNWCRDRKICTIIWTYSEEDMPPHKITTLVPLGMTGLKVKNHTHVKKAHLKISFWYLLMKLKNKYLFKKNCLSGSIQNKIILILTILHFFFKKEKHLEIPLFYTCVPKTLMIWSTVPEYRVKLVTLGNFLSIHPPLKTQKIKILKKWNHQNMRPKQGMFKTMYAPKINLNETTHTQC